MQGPINGNPWRITLFIRNARTTISETHWLTSNISVPATVMGYALQLATDRAEVIGSDAEVFRARASQDNIFRDVLLNDQTLPGSASNSTCDPRGSSILIRMTAGAKRWKSLFLGCVPDTAIIDGRRATPAQLPGWNQRLLSYLDYLKSSPFGFAALDDSNALPLGNPLIQITEITPLTVGNVTVVSVTAPGHYFVLGDIVRIRGMRGQDQRLINGDFVVGTVTGDVFNLQSWPSIVPIAGPWKKFGKVSRQEKNRGFKHLNGKKPVRRPAVRHEEPGNSGRNQGVIHLERQERSRRTESSFLAMIRGAEDGRLPCIGRVGRLLQVRQKRVLRWYEIRVDKQAHVCRC